MDDERFDDLIRRVATGPASRRRVLAALAALAGGIAAAPAARPAAARPRRRKDPCATNDCPSCRTCGHDDQGNPICKDFLDRDTCGGCDVVCGSDQDCCLGTCRTRLTTENCDQCEACPPGDGWVCNPKLNDTDGDGVGDAPGCDCVDEAACAFF